MEFWFFIVPIICNGSLLTLFQHSLNHRKELQLLECEITGKSAYPFFEKGAFGGFQFSSENQMRVKQVEEES